MGKNTCGVISTKFLNKMELGHYCWFLVRVIIPIMMINIGAQNLPNQHLGAEDVVPQNQSVSEPIAELTQAIARDPCPNGAAYWLYAAGICLLVSSVLLPCVLCGMTAGVTPLAFPYVVLVITELSCLIWGSLLVFPAYRDWTYDLEEFSEDYCE